MFCYTFYGVPWLFTEMHPHGKASFVARRILTSVLPLTSLQYSTALITSFKNLLLYPLLDLQTVFVKNTLESWPTGATGVGKVFISSCI